jgi:hypothetical protein
MDDDARRRRDLIAMLVAGLNPRVVWPSLFARSGYSEIELQAFLLWVLALPWDEPAARPRGSSMELNTGTSRRSSAAGKRPGEDAVAALGAAGRFLLPPQRAEAERLESLRETDLLHTGPEESFDRVVVAAKEYFDVQAASLSLIAEDAQYLKSAVGPLREETPRNIAFCSQTVQRNSMFVINDTLADERWASNALVVGEPHIRFYAGYPLHGPRGWNIGSLCIIDQKPRSFGPSEQQVLRALAAIVQRNIDARI